MKSRLTIILMLVAGMVLSTSGAGLAITSLGSNASVVQYGGEEGQNDNNGGNDKGDTLGANGAGNAGATNDSGNGSGVQPARQIETGAGSGQLPFTGFLAIPVLLGGVALLSAGIVLRRRATD